MANVSPLSSTRVRSSASADEARALARALKLDPTPQQRIRLRLTLGEKLLANGQTNAAIASWQEFLREAPGYPGANDIQNRIDALKNKP